jgi:sugar phosphate isomerase/epimerase
MPQLAAFPKAYMQALCRDGSMRVSEWIELSGRLDLDGLEWYAGFLEMADQRNWARFRMEVEQQGRSIPMLCCSPDFTHPDPLFRKKEIARQKAWIDMTRILGGSYCRVLSGQRRPGLSRELGLELAAESIQDCLSYASDLGITLVLENHYKDDFWDYPEFAQQGETFCKLVEAIDHPCFGVNFDPSNAWLAGESPLDLLQRILPRVRTMHASDRYLEGGSLEELRLLEAGSPGYARILKHGEIGKGLNDYDAIFTALRGAGFDGWISIEDGVDGIGQLARSVSFLRQKIADYWPT